LKLPRSSLISNKPHIVSNQYDYAKANLVEVDQIELASVLASSKRIAQHDVPGEAADLSEYNQDDSQYFDAGSDQFELTVNNQTSHGDDDPTYEAPDVTGEFEDTVNAEPEEESHVELDQSELAPAPAGQAKQVSSRIFLVKTIFPTRRTTSVIQTRTETHLETEMLSSTRNKQRRRSCSKSLVSLMTKHKMVLLLSLV
jgi:hypothetical protein